MHFTCYAMERCLFLESKLRHSRSDLEKLNELLIHVVEFRRHPRPRSLTMRKIIESTLVSLDGVFGDPHIWATEYFDQEAEKYALELLSVAEAMLMGRRTYEFFAAAFPHQTGEYGTRINSIRKYIFSNTLKKAGWSNSSI